jgi:hypothetical protein
MEAEMTAHRWAAARKTSLTELEKSHRGAVTPAARTALLLVVAMASAGLLVSPSAALATPAATPKTDVTRAVRLVPKIRPVHAASLGREAGSPAVLYDPLSTNLEVYVVGRDHALLEKFWNPSTGWSRFLRLGGYVLGNPAVLYDPLSPNLEVYVVGRDHALLEKFWNPSTGWSRFLRLGGYVLGNPAVLYDPLSTNLEVYVVGRDHALLEKFWNPSTGWSRFLRLGGFVSTI